MLTTHISLVALLLVGIFCGGADAKKRTSSAYTIEVEQKHQRPRGYSRTLADFKDISFSGDLAPIIALAEELAKEEEEEDNSGGGDNSGGNVTAETSIGCADDYSTEESFITFMYEIETVTDPTQVDGRDLIEAQDVQLSVERALNDVLANALLECPTMRRRRSLVDGAKEQIGIVEFDYWPTDEPISDDPTCSPQKDPANTCRTLEGVMTVSYKSGSDVMAIEYAVGNVTKNWMSSDPDIPGLARVEYIALPISDPSDATDGQPEENTEVHTDGGTLSSRSIVFMSLASVGFVVAVGMVTYFRMRKANDLDEVPYVATLENESSAEESHEPSGDESSQSPFTTIMPSVYRMESPFSSIATSIEPSMGTIHESDDDRRSSDCQSIMISSDGGYSSTEEPSMEYPFFESAWAKTPSTLGARPRTEDELDDGTSF